MKLHLLLVLLASTISTHAATAKPKKSAARITRRTVVDYFRLLPAGAGIFEAASRESLIGRGTPHLIDAPNDYLQVTGDGAQPDFQIAVFRHRGRDLIAVSSNSRVGDYGFNLWRYEAGKWKVVTTDLSPLVGDTGLHFVLPRQGTTIRVFQPNGTLLAKLYWENGRFSAESLRP